MHSELKKKKIIKINKNLLLEDLNNLSKSYTVYKMRNSEIMRKNSINKRKIKYSSHKNWFIKYINKNKIYLVHYNQKYVGYLRLDFQKLNKIEVSIFVKEKFQNKNIASRILKFAFLKFKKYKFIAKVLKKNTISKNFFLKNGFKITNSKRKLFIIS